MISLSKVDARKAVASKLSQISPEEYIKKSSLVQRKVHDFLVSIQNDQPIEKILLYHPIEEWREIDLSSLELVFPTVNFAYISKNAKAPMPSELYDCVLVPLYGFNKDSFRLGHGGGWFDKFLATQPHAIKIGVSLEVGCINFKEEPHDISMDIIITEN